MILQSKLSAFFEVGKLIHTLSHRIKGPSGRKKAKKKRDDRIRMAVLSGSIRRVK
jgi:hypothetical protein